MVPPANFRPLPFVFRFLVLHFTHFFFFVVAFRFFLGLVTILNLLASLFSRALVKTFIFTLSEFNYLLKK